MFTQKYKRNKIFNKNFYRMSANIKDYQSKDRKSALSFTKLSFVLYIGCLFTKGSLSVLTSSCHVCLHSHKMLWLF